MNDEAPHVEQVGADAQRLFERLRLGTGTRRRHLQLREAYSEVFPERATDGDRDEHLDCLLVELAGAGRLTRSKGSGPHPLPAFIDLKRPARPIRLTGIGVPAFHPALDAARDVRPGWLPEELAILEAVSAFLRASSDAPIVARRERSYELFGDEKRLDALQRSARFAPFVSDALLHCVDTPLPFAWVRVGERVDARLLVIENSATFDSLAVVLGALDEPPFDIVVWGAGGAIRDTLPFAGRLSAHAGIKRVASIEYFGDLDPPGVEIAVQAAALSAAHRLPPVRAAAALYRALSTEQTASYTATYPPHSLRALAWLPDDIARRVVALHEADRRIPQEALDRLSLERIVRGGGLAISPSS